MLTNYDKLERPVEDDNLTLNVSIGISIQQIVHLVCKVNETRELLSYKFSLFLFKGRENASFKIFRHVYFKNFKRKISFLYISRHFILGWMNYVNSFV